MKYTLLDSLSLLEEFESLEDSEDEMLRFGDTGYVGAGMFWDCDEDCCNEDGVASNDFCWEYELHDSSSLIL